MLSFDRYEYALSGSLKFILKSKFIIDHDIVNIEMFRKCLDCYYTI